MDNNNRDAERTVTIYLSDFWRGFKKFWWVVSILTFLCGGLMFYKSYVKFAPIYQTSATFTIHTENAVLEGESGVSAYSFYYDRNTADQLSNVFPYILQNTLLQEQVCEDLGMSYMPATVSASCVPGTNMITLTSTGEQPKLTYNVLMSVIDNYPSVSEYIIGRTQLVMITEPYIPEEPMNASSWRGSTLKGIIFGLVLGFDWILIYAILRKTVRTKDDIRTVLNQHCIGVLPNVTFKRYHREFNSNVLISNILVGNHFLESLRLLRSSIQSAMQDSENVLVVTSTAPGEGKSIVTLNLAAMFAKNSSKILVIDGDLRNSGIQNLIASKALETELLEECNNAEFSYRIEQVSSLGIKLLRFNDDSKKNIYKILRTAKLKELIAPLREKYDLILIDTPPSGMISDAAIFASAADSVLYVVRQDTVMSKSIQAGINTLLSTNVKLLGCVLNGITVGVGSYGNYYGGYRYGYYGKYGYGRKSNY